ncbi:MAG TPA: thioesterase family protein, partial [Pyrinomonadaceae bacterium]
ILASTQCKFKIPLTYPDTVSVGTKISEIEADRFNMKYTVVSHAHAKVAAEGEGLIVSYDYRAQKKAPLPDEIKERIRILENSAPR